jgi:hypothetical protein
MASTSSLFSMGNLLSSRDVEDDWKSDAQYAMEAGTYCVICGGPFDIEGDVYNLDPKEPRYQVGRINLRILSNELTDLQWLFDFRLLGQVEELNIHRVTSGESEQVASFFILI